MYKHGDRVLVTSVSVRTKEVNLSKEDNTVLVETRLVEETKHIATVMKRKYTKLALTTDGVEEVLFDGMVYYCDDGSAYFPDFEQNGKTVILSTATEEDIELYGI